VVTFVVGLVYVFWCVGFFIFLCYSYTQHKGKKPTRQNGGTSVHTRSTRHHMPEDGILHSHRCEILKSYKIKVVPYFIPSYNSYLFICNLFKGRDTTLAVVSNDTMIIMNWKGCRRRRPWLNLKSYLDIWLEGLGKIAKILVRRAGVPAEIRIGHTRIQARSVRASADLHSLREMFLVL
jgi:hypothetical protein